MQVIECPLLLFLTACPCCYSLPLKGYVKLPPEKFAQKKQGEASKDLPTESKKLQLNSAEELYAEIRDKNFNAVGAALSKKAKIISAAFEVGLASVSKDYSVMFITVIKRKMLLKCLLLPGSHTGSLSGILADLVVIFMVF